MNRSRVSRSARIPLPRAVHADRIRACWMGKAIGGMAGMPYEGVPYPLDLRKIAVPSGQIPNDDLEMQLLWLVWAEKHGASLRAAHLCEAREHYEAYPDEYGAARWNLARGLRPPVTGLHNNAFTDGMGAAIRSEIWACLFPGDPERAAAFAREDAIVDHHGNGVWAEMLLAAAESSAFTAASAGAALRRGLACIPADCRVAQAVRFAMGLRRSRMDDRALRDAILRRFGSVNFTDVSMNLAFIALALVRGGGDFDRTLRTAVSCGMDTDCTGATCGAFLGLLGGTRALPLRYRRASGERLVVSACLRALPLPKDVGEATVRVLDLSDRMRAACGAGPLPGATPDAGTDPVHDHNGWLLFRVPGEEGYESEPAACAAAQQRPERFRARRLDAPGIHLDLGPHVRADGDILYLLTWVRTPRDVDGQLMVCADTGVTAWLDGVQVLNYHGRQRAVPSFHRVEGGGAIPVRLAGGRAHLLKIRLLGCFRPLRLTAAFGEGMSGRFVTDIRYAADPRELAGKTPAGAGKQGSGRTAS